MDAFWLCDAPVACMIALAGQFSNEHCHLARALSKHRAAQAACKHPVVESQGTLSACSALPELQLPCWWNIRLLEPASPVSCLRQSQP